MGYRKAEKIADAKSLNSGAAFFNYGVYNMEFEEFKKIARWSRDIVISEKIDGINSCIFIGEDGEFFTASRTRWITPADDNYGFSKWAHENKDDLMSLGIGKHFGEWWGAGIQRCYDQDRKRFSLFNTLKWNVIRPECCDVVWPAPSGRW